MSKITAYWEKEDLVLHTTHHDTASTANRSEGRALRESIVEGHKHDAEKFYSIFCLIILIDFGENDFYIISKAEENIEKIAGVLYAH